MKFRCERDALVEGLSTTARIATNKTGYQLVLSGVHVSLVDNELTLTATDRELVIRVCLTVNGQNDGETVLPARLASDVLRSLNSGAVNVELKEQIVKIDASQCNFHLNTMNPADFPQINVLEGDPVVIKADKFQAAIRQVVQAASSDESRPVLTGALMAADENGLRLVTTDSYRLALCDLDDVQVLESGKSVLVPSRALQEIIRLLENVEDINLWFSEKEAAFSIQNIMIITRLIEGDFPSYQSLIPDHQPNHLTLNRENFINAVRRIRLMASDSIPIRLNMSKNGLELSAGTEELGKATEHIEAEFEGEELTVAFNPEYLIDGAEAAPGKEIVLNTVDGLKPAVIRASEAKDYLYLLMPVRIN
ncbi:MAG: DNA polymerase III subunit beta [Acidimicrobiia bacterium]|nr:DNA polymerase III subunit beta [Acidimicrobiia bacterium]MYG94852.1 DNA polymerase III subunit beta [Acidimicrobiia bacterium]MYI30074.1 DNA polymerase III subunit beta [Acidimicrobiia bacterium]